MLATLQQALKEWSVAVEALAQGETILLLRKGGLRDVGDRFQVQQKHVVLLPTYEHPNPAALKPIYAARLTACPVSSGAGSVVLTSWAAITAAWPLTDRAVGDRLAPFHVWSPAGLATRWQWRPQQPLMVLLLRVYRLATPHRLLLRPQDRGCRSWLELPEPISLAGSQPVLDTATYEQQVAAIRQAIGL